MGKKKKKGKSRAANDYEEAKEEVLALQSIYDEDLSPFEDGNGFSMVIKPHPGDAASNNCSISLQVRYILSTHLHNVDISVAGQVPSEVIISV